jgi:hypothetical protein
MLSEYRHTLGSSPNNRKLQRSSVVAIFETSIHLVITQELRYDGGVVEVYCTVQCGVVGQSGVVGVTLNIQIHTRMVHLTKSPHPVGCWLLL